MCIAANISTDHSVISTSLIFNDLKQIGLVMGVGLAVILYLGFGALSSLFSTDSEVLEIARSGTLVRICTTGIIVNTLIVYALHLSWGEWNMAF